MSTIKARTLSGFNDYLPQQMAVRQHLLKIIQEVYESYGFEQLNTPTLEYADVLLGKYGQEADKLVYRFNDLGGRDVAMRYDLTVPLARVAAQYQDLVKPFKRYQIQPVWRADRPGKGRYREFTQCDVDVIGSSSPLTDAELITILYEVYTRIGFKQFTVRINSRQVLFTAMKEAKIPEDKALTVIQSIDKLDKLPKSGVEAELKAKGFSSIQIENIFAALGRAKPDPYLQQVLEHLEMLGVDSAFYRFDPILARGLDYYTGPIFETVVEEPKIGSISAGGRYDQLIGRFTGKSMPACGTSIGLERVVDVIVENGIWGDIAPSVTQVLVAQLDPALESATVGLSQELRQAGIRTELYHESAKLATQLKYANKKQIPFIAVYGPDEAKNEMVLVKDMKSGKQKLITLNQVAAYIKGLLP
jgi:histidyl-tRNA synthetase